VARKLSIGTAWAEAAAFVRNERRLLAPVVLGLVMVPAVIASMVQPDASPGARPEPGGWMIVTLITLLAMIIGQLAIALLATGWRGSVGAAIGRGVKRLPTLILAGFAIMIPIFIAMTVIMLLSGVEPGGDGLGSRSSAGPASSLLVLLFVPAVLYLAVRLLPLVPIVANSDHGPITALKRSFAMTRGNFWKLLGFVLLLAIAFLVAGVAISAVVGTLVTLAFGRPEPWSVSLLLIALVGGLIQAAFVTIYSAMLARIAVQLDDAPTSGT
jgi:hypothetical protein